MISTEKKRNLKLTTPSLAVFFFFYLFSTIPLFAQSPREEEQDKSSLSFFVQPGISFLNFSDRSQFQKAIDTIYADFKAQAITKEESLYVAKQDFQKVNFCFPVSLGFQWQWRQDHFVSLGAGFIYDNESVVLTDRRDKIHNYEYTLQGFPLFLEYRLAIPKNLITISGESLFSVAFRWYWMLPGTEIYSSWGQIKGDTPIWGNGFGFSLGYLVTTWKSIHIYSDLGFTSITVDSDDSFSKVVPNGSTKKASWNLGGIQLQFRFSFGVTKMNSSPLDAKPTENTAVTKPK